MIRVPKAIWTIGFVSLLMDVSSEMIHALLPVYLVVGLGASTLAVGVIEGIAEATAMMTKVFSGALSDRLGNRKFLTALGYGMAALTKPIFPLASGLGWIVAARFIDRIGKGIRGAPRDALITDLTTPDQRGAAFGLRQSLDTIGAFLGPLIAIALMWASGNHFSTVFWVAVIPGLAAFALIVIAVREPPRPAGAKPVRAPLSRAELGKLPPAYWRIVLLSGVFTLARFSEAFLILRAQQAGLALMLIPLVLVLMNVVYAGTAYPAGVLADRVNRNALLAIGLALLIAADLALAYGGLAMIAIGVAFWGLHMGMTQGVLAAMIADAAPENLRGTGFGVFNLASGIAALVSSALAGLLWDTAGAPATFLAGATFAALALFLTLRR